MKGMCTTISLKVAKGDFLTKLDFPATLLLKRDLD